MKSMCVSIASMRHSVGCGALLRARDQCRHDVILIRAAYVDSYVKRGKTDAID